MSWKSEMTDAVLRLERRLNGLENKLVAFGALQIHHDIIRETSETDALNRVIKKVDALAEHLNCGFKQVPAAASFIKIYEKDAKETK